jgi:hypothetical protein
MKFGAFETLDFNDGTHVFLQNGRVTEVRLGKQVVQNFQTPKGPVQTAPKDPQTTRTQNLPDDRNTVPKEVAPVPPQFESKPPEPKHVTNSILPAPHPGTGGVKAPTHSAQAVAELRRPAMRPLSTNLTPFATVRLNGQTVRAISFSGTSGKSLNSVVGLMPWLLRLAQGFALLFLGFLVGVYLFTCHCFRKICQKAGEEPGFLIWIPLAQFIPLLRAAQMPPWTLILLLVPVANLVIVFSLWVKICVALGKNPWLVVLLLVPIANLGLIAYLAFCDSTPRPPELKDSIKIQASQRETISV